MVGHHSICIFLLQFFTRTVYDSQVNNYRNLVSFSRNTLYCKPIQSRSQPKTTFPPLLPPRLSGRPSEAVRTKGMFHRTSDRIFHPSRIPRINHRTRQPPAPPPRAKIDVKDFPADFRPSGWFLHPRRINMRRCRFGLY